MGVVSECGHTAKVFGITPGARVASVSKSEFLAKHMAISPKHLVTVPKTLDAADVASVMSSYLPAFQALHHGRSRPYRYLRGCLKGKRILVTGGITVVSQALVRLAEMAGAAEIFWVAQKEHHSAVRGGRKVVMLDEDPDTWLPTAYSHMDIVIDYEFPRNFSLVRQTVAKKGRLVCVPRGKMTLLNGFLEQVELSAMKRATIFDFKDSIFTYRDALWEDTSFLLRLLANRQVRPDIDRYVSFKEIQCAHDEVLTKPIAGSIICEPWKEA